MKTASLSPLRLVEYTLLGCALLIASYALSFFPFSDPLRSDASFKTLWSARWEIALTAAPFLIGSFLVWRSMSSLGKGIRTERWSEAQTAHARTYIEARAFTWIVFAMIPVSIALIILMRSLWHHHGGFAYMLIWAVYPIGWMRKMLRTPEKNRPRTDWGCSAPLHSSHWGQPSAGL